LLPQAVPYQIGHQTHSLQLLGKAVETNKANALVLGVLNPVVDSLIRMFPCLENNHESVADRVVVVAVHPFGESPVFSAGYARSFGDQFSVESLC
jgi:hypothetical protein